MKVDDCEGRRRERQDLRLEGRFRGDFLDGRHGDKPCFPCAMFGMQGLRTVEYTSADKYEYAVGKISAVVVCNEDGVRCTRI